MQVELSVQMSQASPTTWVSVSGLQPGYHSPASTHDEEELDESERESMSSGIVTPPRNRQYQELTSRNSPHQPQPVVMMEMSATDTRTLPGVVPAQHHPLRSEPVAQPPMAQWQTIANPLITTPYRSVTQTHQLATTGMTPTTSQHASQLSPYALPFAVHKQA